MKWIGGNQLAPETAFTGVSIDSRRVRQGDLFVALRGARLDGHDFVFDALRRGARAALVEQRWLESRPRRQVRGQALLPVPDTLEALQALARYHRRRIEIPMVAVTGSNGKTTTKEMIAAVLGTRMRTLRSEHSYNNHIGVPLTLLRLRQAHEAAVLEMGMNHPGEIARLCRLAEPTAGVITNIGPVHLAYFEGIEGVAQAKGELAEALGPDGFLVLNADDPLAWGLRERTSARVIGFGFQPGAEVGAALLEPERGVYPRLRLEGEQINLRVPGRHHAANALAAAAVGLAMGCTPSQIREGLESYRGIRWRLEPVSIGQIVVLNDAYNANPVSASIALETLRRWDNGRPHRRVAVLGDMLELGETAEGEHLALGRAAGQGGLALLVAVGTWAATVAEGARQAGMPAGAVHTAADTRQAWQLLAPRLIEGDLVLLKGSRAVGLEGLVDLIQLEQGGAPAAPGQEG